MLCDVGNDLPREAEVVRRRLLELAERDSFDFAVLREVRERRLDHAATTTAGTCCRTRHVFERDPAAGARAADARQIQTEFASEASGGGTGW